MEDTDDDFGDLYADVEFQASSTINGLSNIGGLCIEQNESTECLNSDPKNGDGLIQDDDAKRDSSAEANGGRDVGVDNGSDSEDDLNIVLNDDGGSVFPVARGMNLRSGELDEDEDGDGEEGDGRFEVIAEGDGLIKNRRRGDQSLLCDELELSPKCGGERGNGSKGGYQLQYVQNKYVRPHRASFLTNSKASGSVGTVFYSSTSVRDDWDDNKCNQRLASKSLVALSGHNFSLPRYRTILDVNIETLERKLWKQPGTDITDFFNFGFDEESWKVYCKRLEQLRQKTSLLTRTPVYDLSKAKEAYEAGAHEAVPEKVAPTGEFGTFSPVSRIAYRKAQMPKGRVIQVEDSVIERQPFMDFKRSVDRDPDVVIQIPVQDCMEDSSASRKEKFFHEEAHEASQNGDFVVDDHKVIQHFGSGCGDDLSREFLEGCSQLTTPSNPVSVDSDNNGSSQISDVDGQCNQKVTTGSSSKGNAEAMETSNNTGEKACRDTWNTAPSVADAELLLCEHTRHDQSASYSGNHNESSGDVASTDSERSQNHLRRQTPYLATKLGESVTSDYSKSHHGRTKTQETKYYARNRNPIIHDLKHYSRRLHNESEFKHHHGYEDSSHFRNGGRNNDGYYSTYGHSSKDKRPHGFDTYDSEDFSCKESESFFNYSGKECSHNEVHAIYSKKPRGNRHRFGDETERYHSRWGEGEYFLEQRVSHMDHEVIGSDWHHYERGITWNPLICKKSRQLVLNYSSDLDRESVTRWRGKGDEFQFRKRIEKGGFSLDCKYQYDFLQNKYGHYAKYQRNLPSNKRSSGRNGRKYDSPSIDLDYFGGSVYNDDEYWRTDHRSLSSRSYREPRTANRGRVLETISPRNGYDPRLTEGHGRHRRPISKERSKCSDWFGSNHNAGDTQRCANYPIGQVHIGRQRPWQSESFHWTEDEYMYRHEEDEFLYEETPFSFGMTSKYRRIGAKQKLIDDVEIEQRGIKSTGERNSSNCIGRSSIIHRGNHEKPLLRCSDSFDLQLVVREGKSSGRCLNPGSITDNDKHENKDHNIDKEQVISADSSPLNLEKANSTDNPKVEINQNDENWVDKFPVTQKNEALDIEEGQIITEDVNQNPVIENFGSEDCAEASGEKKKSLHDEDDAARGDTVGDVCENPRILEVMAKMEKRRERFKEPMTLKRVTERIPKPQVDLVVETTKTEQQRPARKRRWGGN